MKTSILNIFTHLLIQLAAVEIIYKSASVYPVEDIRFKIIAILSIWFNLCRLFNPIRAVYTQNGTLLFSYLPSWYVLSLTGFIYGSAIWKARKRNHLHNSPISYGWNCAMVTIAINVIVEAVRAQAVNCIIIISSNEIYCV